MAARAIIPSAASSYTGSSWTSQVADIPTASSHISSSQNTFDQSISQTLEKYLSNQDDTQHISCKGEACESDHKGDNPQRILVARADPVIEEEKPARTVVAPPVRLVEEPETMSKAIVAGILVLAATVFAFAI